LKIEYDPKRQPHPAGGTARGRDRNINLIYSGARYYDPMMGRFITADSIVSDIYDPQDLNRYAYCRNNPMKYVDPDGHAWFDAIPGTIGAVGNFGATALAYAFTRPAIGALWLIDPKGAAQANSGLNDAFGRVLHIQTGIAASAVVGDTAGAAVGAGVQYVKNARQAARATAEVAKEVQAGSKGVVPEPKVGDEVTRHWGGTSGGWGQSWTRDPLIQNTRDSLGLGISNTGEYVTQGVLKDTTGVTARRALPWGRFKGGGDEILVPNPSKQIEVKSLTMPEKPLPDL